MEESGATSSIPQTLSFGNTPKRTIQLHQRMGTPLSRIKEKDTLETDSETKTPVGINPFEVKADSLYFPACSPSVFATFARNKTNNGQFRWSIDHVSLLYPADIDETSVQDAWVDPDHEQQAQKAIDAFFSQNSIVPSPWSSDSKNRRDIKVRRTIRECSFLPTNDVGTQTKLTIPPNVDLLELLGSDFQYDDSNENSYSSSNSSSSSFRESDVMSASSLRRKLFATDEDCKTPSRLERKDLNLAKQWTTPTINMRSFQSTPSDLLSSSPITPPNCSESCVIRSSPQMSPITGPSSHKSIRMQSFFERLDEESNSQSANKPSSQYNHASENSMSFSTDSQDTGTFQSYASGRQDTGYVTGSMFSLQNMISSDSSTCFQSRVTPAVELLDDCGFFNATSNMSCSSENVSPSKCKVTESVLCSSDKWSLAPNHCSTPALNL